MNRGDLLRVAHPSGDAKNARVFVIVSRADLIESTFSTAGCAPVYTERRGLSTEVYIGTAEALKHDSAILCDALVSLEKSRLSRYVGSLSHDKLTGLGNALRIALDRGRLTGIEHKYGHSVCSFIWTCRVAKAIGRSAPR